MISGERLQTAINALIIPYVVMGMLWLQHGCYRIFSTTWSDCNKRAHYPVRSNGNVMVLAWMLQDLQHYMVCTYFMYVMASAWMLQDLQHYMVCTSFMLNVTTQKCLQQLISNFIDAFHEPDQKLILPLWQPSVILCKFFICQYGPKSLRSSYYGQLL